MFSLRHLCNDLHAAGHLVRLEEEIDPVLEAAEIQRRVYASGGPAVYFANVKGTRFPMLSNLFGTIERARYVFRHTYDKVRRAIELKIEPQQLLKNPLRYISAPLTAWRMQPKSVSSGPILGQSIKISEIPNLKSWPMDGGPFVTLPQCYTEDPDKPGLQHSNLGMYRVQLAGNDYKTDEEIGLHYQLHRGIGVHHTAALRRNEPFRVNVFVGGHPAMSLAAVMPLPEGMPELTFAGALAGHRIPMIRQPGKLPIYGDADFCIQGVVLPGNPKKMEGPFGDHLGYYSLAHEFPVMKVEKVWARKDAVWHFTVVGRPPQEDTTFGELIHDLTGPVIPTVIHGVKGVNAVDAAGVHPLLLAIGSERYMPFHNNPRPQEILTQANAILGQGQMSLAKWLLIVSSNDNPDLDVHDIPAHLKHLLERIDWTRDVHFQTCTTIDTLDYSGDGLNTGSKCVLAAAGAPIRTLGTELPRDLKLADGFSDPRIAIPGVLMIQSPNAGSDYRADRERFCRETRGDFSKFPLLVLVDDSQFSARTLNNFLWTTFTRSNPAIDIDGLESFTRDKHWGCRGPLVIDARVKPHHAPPLVEDPAITSRVDALAARGGPLAKWL
ncbi:Carboxylyase-related protein [Pirellula staleyi DSM 6068]|uniref:Carboxylyase-related protein n=1 Tax=Pirellula staleyi (strain ATCC 27377 / DSM 6068 / ICPB 4128) TaxID=530564 RepID=D2R8B6_PIRSD|nr:UbiD family decarboxylase [Pirellula staleyi]ADB15733.1 Carboxylyase-related protein [Pirellula staleyi DSM 6068]